MSWFIDELLNGNAVFNGVNTIVFRIAFALCLILKFSVESQRGYFNYFNDGEYLSVRYNTINQNNWILTQQVWKIMYILKIISVSCLLFGFIPKLSLIVLIIWFIIELIIYFKYHTNFMFLLCLILLFSKSIESNSFFDSTVEEYLILPLFIYITLFSMYIFGAIKKYNKAYLSGTIVARTIAIFTKESHRRKYFDFHIPNFIKSKLVTKQGEAKNTLSTLMYIVLILELIIPIGFLFESTFYFACSIGLILHTGLTFLFPKTLLHFSLVTICSYCLLIQPTELLDTINHIF